MYGVYMLFNIKKSVYILPIDIIYIDIIYIDIIYIDIIYSIY